MAKQSLDELLQSIRETPGMMQNITDWHVLPASPAKYADFPEGIAPSIKDALKRRGIERLYTHQAEAVQNVLDGRDIVVVTPTASGKTLCYNLPVLSSIIADSDTRALYIFPTKALSADQVAEMNEIIGEADVDIKAFTYDGDTSANARQAIRTAGHIVVTNPDMLHSGILPQHTKWVKLFENLKYIVIDEIHTYRGVFGSHMANVLRRLKRVCAFYGSHPQFICCSATINNPMELASRLTGRDMVLIDNNGAPVGERNIIFYNPPVVNKQLGIRASSLLQARRIASMLINNDIRTIVFARSRLTVEVLISYLKELVADTIGDTGRIRGYRGGYLPTQRREIERGLRQGSVLGVVATNALELGVDIGGLQACVICGYPGSIAAAWQQAGRVGRRQDTSAVFMVASSAPLDQYIINHPGYFYGAPPEAAYINPDNLYILTDHLKCAAFELPFSVGEDYAGDDTEELLSYLVDGGILRRAGGKYHWMSDEFPANAVNLRSSTSDDFTIIDISSPKHRVIGRMDRFTVPMLLHEEAIYMHEGTQYQVETLDFEEHKAYIRKVDVDYYTDAQLSVRLAVLDEFKDRPSELTVSFGEVLVSCMVPLYKKIKFDTHENIGWGQVRLPELDMHTSALWFTLPDGISEGMKSSALQDALVAMTNVIAVAAPVMLLCDPKDLAVVYEVRSPHTGKPTVFIYDTAPGGAGLSEKLYDRLPELISAARDVLTSCPCENGCPACIGAPGKENANIKGRTAYILGEVLKAL